MFSIVFYKGFVVCSLCSVLLGFKYAFLLSCFIGVLHFVAFCSCFIVGSGLQVQYAFLLSVFIAFPWSAPCVAFCRGLSMRVFYRVL